jgi:hypothetical protein
LLISGFQLFLFFQKKSLMPWVKPKPAGISCPDIVYGRYQLDFLSISGYIAAHIPLQKIWLTDLLDIPREAIA